MLESSVLVDAACDVPDGTLQSGCVSLLPTWLIGPGGRRLDSRNQVESIAYMAQLKANGPRSGSSEPMTTPEITHLLKARLQSHTRPMLALHVSGSRSQTVTRVAAAAASLADRPGLHAQNRLHILDSGSLFAGYGVQLVDFLDQEQRAMDWQSLMHRARRNIAYSHMYFVPYTLDFIAANTRTRGDRTVRMTSKLAASIFNITPILYASQGKTMLIARRVGLARAREVVFAKARQMIRTQKLMSPHIVVSYAGDPDDVEHMPGYQRLLALARLSDVTVHLAVMGMVNAVNVGPYALSIGYIADADCSQSMHTIA